MSLTIVAHRRNEQFLVDVGDGQGRVFDNRKGVLYEPFAIDAIVERGHWVPTSTSTVEAGIIERIGEHLPTEAAPEPETREEFLSENTTAEVTSEDGPGEFTLTILDESKPTIDGRSFEPGMVTWRDLPLPLMYTTENTHEGHKGSVAAGSIREIWREGSLIKGKGVFSAEPEGQHLRRMIKEGTLSGVSADVGGAIQEESLAENGAVQKRIMEGRIMGATVLPFQAFDDTRIAVTAAASVPVHPPRDWFAAPSFDGPTPITVTADGQVYGHAALWGTCHIGRQGQCLTPPKSRTGYAHFTTGAVECADGTQVAVGPITLGTGHAPLSLSARPAAEHYDNTGAVVADVAAGEDAYGIWVAGALRPELAPTRVRELRASALSGDWRAVGGSLELVALLAVNTPGFPIPRVTARFASEHQMALVAAGIPGQPEPSDEDVEQFFADCVECAETSTEPDVVEEFTVEELAEYTERLDAIEAAILALAMQTFARKAMDEDEKKPAGKC